MECHVLLGKAYKMDKSKDGLPSDMAGSGSRDSNDDVSPPKKGGGICNLMFNIDRHEL